MTGIEYPSRPSNPLDLPGRVHFASPVTVLCDFDGPLVDVSERYYRTYQLSLVDTQAAYEAEGITLPVQELTKQQFWQMKQERVADTEIALRSGLRSRQIEKFLENVHQRVNQPALLQQDQLQPGVRWALALLHARGVNLAVVTLRCQTQAQQVLRDYGLDQLFTVIRGAPDELAAYPNYTEAKKQLLAEVLANCSHPPSQTWLVGDTEADVLAGQAQGISTIALTCGIRSVTYLKQLQPTRIHCDLRSAAHYLSGLVCPVEA